MKLQGRTLGEGATGPEVRTLHAHLALLRISIPPDEVRDGRFGSATARAVAEFQRRNGLPPDSVVTERVARYLDIAANTMSERTWRVEGVVRSNDRQPLGGVLVRAFHEGLDGETLLASASTDASGAYGLSFSNNDIKSDRGINLSVRVFGTAGHLIAAAPTVFEPTSPFRLDITVTAEAERALTDYEKVAAEMSRLSDRGPGRQPPPTLTRLSGESGIPVELFERYQRVASESARSGVPIVILYALDAQGLDVRLEALLARGEPELSSALDNAVQQGQTPRRAVNVAPAVWRRLRSLRRQRIPRSPVRALAENRLVARLASAGDRLPLAGFVVTGVDLEGETQRDELGSARTSADGYFTLSFPTPADAPAPTTRRVRLTVVDRGGRQALESDFTLRVDDPIQPDIEVPAPLDIPTPVPLTAVASEAGLTLSPALLDALSKGSIQTLDDARQRGGLADLVVPAADARVLAALDGHVRLAPLGAARDVSARLIAAGFSDPAAIARVPRYEFVNAMGDTIGDYQAAHLHVSAQAYMVHSDSLLTHLLTQPADATKDPTIQGPQKCGCDDCEAAVSPLAYLADLLRYAADHVRENGAPIGLTFLENRLHQPFATLPVSCEQMDELVRQVRIAVEVLRDYYVDTPPSASAAEQLKSDERAYRWRAYTLLLQRLGTSFEEIRLARTEPAEARLKLANRLGLQLAATHPDLLDDLYLEPGDEGTATFLDAIPETALETLFGLRRTTGNPLVDIPVSQVEASRLDYLRARWRESDFPDDDLAPAPAIDPDVIGPDDFRRPVSTDAAFAIWLERRAWLDQRLAEFAALQASLAGQSDAHIFAAMLNRMYQPVTHPTVAITAWLPTTAVSDFDGLLENLNTGTDVKETLARIGADLRLSSEAFSRLQALRRKALLAANDPGSALTVEDWAELQAILVAATKTALFDAWRQQETTANQKPDPLFYWASLREPIEGAWPPALLTGTPLVDPEEVKLLDLPEPTAGAVARQLHGTRTAQLTARRAELRHVRETQGPEAALEEALIEQGDPPLPDLDARLELLATAKSTSDPNAAAAATAQIAQTFFMELDEFERVVGTQLKSAETAPQNRPSAAEWAEFEEVLTSAWKRKRAVPGWIGEEQTLGLTAARYWEIRKARLPLWRATADGRARWRAALKARSRAPVVDPDLLFPEDFRTPAPTDPAFSIWTARTSFVASTLAALQNTPATTAGFDQMVANSLGVNQTALLDLETLMTQGEDIESRLLQLDLDFAVFWFLLRMRAALFNNGQPGGELLPDEWGDVRSVLVAVMKTRRRGVWRDEEMAANLTHGPDHFVIPEKTFDPLVPPAPPQFPKWRASAATKLEWQDTLQARIDQVEELRRSLADLVSGVEATALPDLRDALVRRATITGSGLDGKARKLELRLLIDMRNSGCQTTTRVSQAIVTMQSLLFGLRNGQTSEAHPQLTLEAPDFDQEWTWLGEYGSWRAAIFVFLYPENLLIPSLIKVQTPAFQQLIATLRSNRRFTPEQACGAARNYEAYFHDVCRLDVRASCVTRATIPADDGCGSDASEHCLLFLFGKSPYSDVIYFSFWDPYDTGGYAQSFWRGIDGVTGAESIVGAVPSTTADDTRAIFLFFVALDKGERKLAVTRYDLESRAWEGSFQTLDLPEDATDFEAVVYQRDYEDLPPQIFLRLRNGTMTNAIVRRALNAAHTDWADADWQVVLGAVAGSSITNLLGAVRGTVGTLHLIGKRDDDRIVHRRVGKMEDGQFYDVDLSSPEGTAGATFVGTLRWPGIEHAFAVWRLGGVRYYSLLSGGTTTYTIEDLWDYDVWLTANTGASLGFTEYDGFPGKDYYLITGIQSNAMSKAEVKGFFPASFSIDVSTAETYWALTIHLAPSDALGQHLHDLSDLYKGIVAINQSLDPQQAPYWWNYAEEIVADIDVLLNEVCAFISDQQESNEGVSDWEFGNALTNSVFGESICSIIKALTREEKTFTLSGQAPQPRRAFPNQDVTRLATSCNVFFETSKGTAEGGGLFACMTADGPFALRLKESSGVLGESGGPRRVAPDRWVSPVVLSPQKSEILAYLLLEWDRVADTPASNLAYLREAWYLVPVHIALQLQRSSQYTAALDWIREVYDYARPESLRFRTPHLVRDVYGGAGFTRPDDWLLDTLNSHGLASTRQGAYRRFTIQTVVRILLDYANAEFTRDTVESVERARTLYQTALDILGVAALKQTKGFCSEIIGTLTIDVPKQWQKAVKNIQKVLADISDASSLQTTVKEIQAILTGSGDFAGRFEQASKLAHAAAASQKVPTLLEVTAPNAAQERARTALSFEHRAAADYIAARATTDLRHTVALISGQEEKTILAGTSPLRWLRTKDPDSQAVSADALARALPLGSTAQLRRLKFDPTSPDSLAARAAVARLQPNTALKQAGKSGPGKTYTPKVKFAFCIPPNPALDALRQAAETNLFKIRNCRNIAGLERQLEPYAGPTDTTTGLPSISDDGQLVLPGTVKFPPTPYRFRVLIERARQLVSYAQQIELSMLTAMEKKDLEAFQLLEARQQLQLTRAGVRLQQLRVTEAQDGVRLAELQQERAQIQLSHFETLLSEGMTPLEKAAIAMLETATSFHQASAILSFVAAALQLAAAGAAIGTNATSEKLGLTGSSVASMGGGLSSLAAAYSSSSSVLAMYASHERQAQEWELQRSLAAQDVRIGGQSIRLAEDRVRIVGQEYAIAQLEADHAEATVDFLTRKFTNVELYDWMSGVLEGVYSYFLQQATAMAQVAAAQLAFERQENAPPYIQADYWTPPSEGLGPGEGTEDRRGLTGSARLLQDISQLDQYAFETARRKLQLTKTFSLARNPIEFQRFRETGVIIFATPMDAFDRDFPGHYLRLIRGVRTSVIALLPPNREIAATLTAVGVSRTVVGGAIFQKVAINHGPRSVALTSPRNATGVFELDQPSEMLGPFEGMGVDALWELRLLRAANALDFPGVADVLVTVEYTALDSFDYRLQVLQSMPSRVSADRAFSFRRDLADAWYDLHNPDQTETPLAVSFPVTRADFGPNLDQLRIDHLAIAFVRGAGTFEIPIAALRHTGADGGPPVGGSAISVDGLVSTRVGNAGAWFPILGREPMGTWQLVFPDTFQTRKDLLKLEDILLVITYSGRAPEWPV